MADVLDQNEVDALLAAVEEGAIDTQPESQTIFTRHRRDLERLEVKTYDFKRPERVSKDQMRALQNLHDAFARNLGASLSGFLRTIVEVKVATCEQMTYSEFIAGLPNPTSFNLVSSTSLEGQMCMEVSPLIIYPIIDRLLGSSSHDLFIPQRAMTLIEAKLISNITKRAMECLSEAWGAIKTLEFVIEASESNPQLVQIVPPNEVVIVIGFELKLTNRAGTMNLCIPYNVIEPLMEILASQSWFANARGKEEDQYSSRIGSSIGRSTLSVEGVLGETVLTLNDLMGLAVGDLLTLDRRADQPVLVSVEGKKKFFAAVGQYRGKRALSIVRAVTPKDRV